MRTAANLHQISQQVEIQWPVQALFNYVSDITNNVAWQNHVIKTEWIQRTGNRIGSTFAEIRNVEGKESFNEIKVTEFIPNQKRTIRINGSEAQCSMHFVSLSDEQTQLTLQLKWNKEQPETQFDLYKLKEVLENEF